MSYVRWSTPISLPDGVDEMDYFLNHQRFVVPTSDFYIYDHVGGFVAVHVAGNRHRPPAPFDGQTSDPGWMEWLSGHRETINHPAAGETFEFAEMSDAIAKVEELIAEGFLAPDWLLDALREEIDDPR